MMWCYSRFSGSFPFEVFLKRSYERNGRYPAGSNVFLQRSPWYYPLLCPQVRLKNKRHKSHAKVRFGATQLMCWSGCDICTTPPFEMPNLTTMHFHFEFTVVYALLYVRCVLRPLPQSFSSFECKKWFLDIRINGFVLWIRILSSN